MGQRSLRLLQLVDRIDDKSGDGQDRQRDQSGDQAEKKSRDYDCRRSVPYESHHWRDVLERFNSLAPVGYRRLFYCWACGSHCFLSAKFKTSGIRSPRFTLDGDLTLQVCQYTASLILCSNILELHFTGQGH